MSEREVDTEPMERPAESEETFLVIEKALLSLWSVVNDLSLVRPPRQRFYRVTIFGSSRMRPGDPTYAEAKELARRLSAMGCDIVTGGGPGLMQAANEGEHLGDARGLTRSYGLPIELPMEEAANPFVEKVFHHRTFFTRLHHFVRLSSAFVVMRGGVGTTLEAFMIWQLLQVRHMRDRPLIFVGSMWREMVQWAERHMLSGSPLLAGREDVAIPSCVETTAEAARLIESDKRLFDETGA